MAFSDDAKRILTENLRNAYAKVGTAVVIALAWLGPYEAAEHLGVPGIWYKLLVVAAFYLIAGVCVIIVFLYRSVRQAYEKLGPEVPTQKILTEVAAKFIGVQKQTFSNEVCILADGSSEGVSDVTLTALANQIRRIEYISATPSVPNHVEGRLEVTTEPRHDGGVKIFHEILHSTPRECFWSINFVPDLRRDKTVNYRYKQKCLPHSFSLNVEEMNQRNLDMEHYSQQITYPTARFRLRVAFTSELNAEGIDYDVWLGRGGIRHMGEYIRVSNQNFFTTGVDNDNRLYGELDVLYPIQGLRYVIRWRPQKTTMAT
jgi:hypothetical protein